MDVCNIDGFNPIYHYVMCGHYRCFSLLQKQIKTATFNPTR